MTDIKMKMMKKEIGVHALVRLPKGMHEIEIGGPRLVTVSRGLSSAVKPPNAVLRTAAKLYLYQRDSSMGPEPWLIFAFDPENKQAGNDTAEDISKYEENPHVLEYVGEVPTGLLWSPSNKNSKLSMFCADMSQKFMDDAVIPHYLLLPKRFPASLRLSKYWQLWVSL
jgi:hypothetical protein